MKLPNFKPITRFGMSQGADRKVGIAAAALPKMRMPSGLAQEVSKVPKIKIAALPKRQKRAYDYAFERRELEEHAQRRHTDTPVGWGKAIGSGAGVGGAVGSAIGAIAKPSMGRLTGVAIGFGGGALLGGLLGAAYGAGDRADIAESKKIVAMPKKERKDYLMYRARQPEVHAAIHGNAAERRLAAAAEREKGAAEVSATREQIDGDLEGGKPLATGLRAMLRSDVATDAAEVAQDQSEFVALHGSATGWESGRP